MVFARLCDVPRWQQSYGQSYTYSGVRHGALPVPKGGILERIQEFVRAHSGQDYLQILVNWYLTGEEYIAAHADDEKDLVPGSSIYSFSFGSTRDFVVTPKAPHINPAAPLGFREVLSLEDNTLVVMGGSMQMYFKHQVPKRLTIKTPRVNVTLRLFRPVPVQ